MDGPEPGIVNNGASQGHIIKFAEGYWPEPGTVDNWMSNLVS